MIECYFSPHGGCAARIAELIRAAQKSIKILAYTFTDKIICDELVKKGNNVTIVQDANGSNGLGCLIINLHHSKANCFVDHHHAIAHNKVMIIDEKILITGSFNFTESAENRNAENILILDDLPTVTKYIDNFNMHLAHSIPFMPTMRLSIDLELYQT